MRCLWIMFVTAVCFLFLITCTNTEMHAQWNIIHNLLFNSHETLHTIPVGALENYTNSNNMIKFLTEL